MPPICFDSPAPEYPPRPASYWSFPVVDLAEPDAPAPAGDPVPCHLFWSLPAEPLPPVLRPDSGAVSLWDALDAWLNADLEDAPAPPVGWRLRVSRFVEVHHEWLAVAAIIGFTALALWVGR